MPISFGMSFIVLLLLFLPRSAYSGHEVRNGGWIVACKVNGMEQGIVLDLAQVEPDIVVDFSNGFFAQDRHLSLEERIQTIGGRVAKFDKVAHMFILYTARQMLAEMKLVDQLDQNELSADIGRHQLHPMCDKTSYFQVASQSHPKNSDGSLLLIIKSGWDFLDDTQKAGLILHEATYRYFLSRGEKNSELTRNFIKRLFVRGVWESMSQSDYENLFSNR